MLISELVVRYAATGYQSVIDAERRVRTSIGETHRQAARGVGVTGRWLERHKTALLAIAGTLGAALYTIARESPSMSAAIGEIHLAMSMFLMDVGERASGTFEALAALTWGLLEQWEKLPESFKNLFAKGPVLGLLDEWGNLLIDAGKWLDDFLGTGTFFENAMRGIVEGIKTLWSGLKITIGGIVTAIVDTAKSNWEKFKQDPIGWGKDLILGIVRGLLDTATNLYTWIGAVLGTISQKFTEWLPNATKWGADLIGNLAAGIRSGFGVLSSAISAAKSMIEGAISFDIVANDRMAQRWGSDMMMHFAAGMRAAPTPTSAPIAPVINVAAPSGGGNTYLTIERGAFVFGGASGSSGVDERKIAAAVQSGIEAALRSRGR